MRNFAAQLRTVDLALIQSHRLFFFKQLKAILFLNVCGACD